MRLFILAAVSLLALASCSKVSQVMDQDQAITFRAVSYINSTKADGQGTQQDTHGTGEGVYHHFNLAQPFGVFAYLNDSAWDDATNATANVYMNNVQVAANGTPSSAYFWPKKSMLTFAAYAPFKNTAPGSFAKGSGFTFTNYSVPSTTDEDLMVVKEVNIPKNMTAESDENGTATHFQAGVPLLFNHLLTKLEFKFKEGVYPPTADVDDSKSYIVINEVKLIGMKNSDTYTSDSWSGTTSGSVEYSITAFLPKAEVTLPGAKEATQVIKVTPDPIDATKAFIVLPQTLVAGVQKLYVNYNIIHYFNTVGEKMEANVVASIDLTNETISAFSANQHIVYTITINPLGESAIQFDPAVMDWDPVTPGAITVND